MSLTWLPLNPLARCAGETRRASAALADYAAMGSGRSLRGLAQQYHESGTKRSLFSTLAKWSVKYDWQARVSAYDAQQQAAVRAATEAATVVASVQEAEDLAAARKKARLDQLKDAELLREKARAILDTLPMVKQVGADPKTGEPLIIAPASSAEYRAAQAMMDSAAKLEAARLGLPAEVQQVDVKSGGERLTFTVVREGAGGE